MHTAGRIAGSVLLAAGVIYLGYEVDRTEFWSLFLAFTLAFVGYGLLVGRRLEGQFRWLLLLGLILRIGLLFAFPRLSDDVYRFIWDGELIVAGENPYVHPPTYYLGEPLGDRELYGRLNSPDYHSIYPPLTQVIFALAAYVSPGWYGAALVMKLFLLFTEVGSVFLIYHLLLRFGLPVSRCLLYWLNPLILVEVVGNLHFEGAMVFFLLLSLLLLTRSGYGRAGLAMALSIASKLLPLMLLPFLLRRLWKGAFWRYFLVTGGGVVLLFAPMLLGSGVLDGFGGSLDLYFRKFEFNASLYYLLRAYGFYDVGYNQIARFGPLLARVAGMLIMIVALADERTDWKSLPGRWLAAFVIYLLCTTTVHPWYLSVPIALCCFTEWRFPLVWSYLIILTYTSYTSIPYQEDLLLVGLEYSVVFTYFVAERKARIKKGPRDARADLVL
ncbi:glycosyltransferase 87 family protein [Lewinella sp. IMCC34191]|uniref:glycosyltransferase 87 family protein n=1 Tax=Lewinella sp. IMCC34191 TaxID=2259172 RepID=UPI000E265129|nr:glycosyltransferase 87 family protein [Lewinella sp. IMCC34191]